MDDESGEIMETAEVTGVGRSESKTVVREKQGVDSRDEVRHSKKTDQLFIKMTMKADGIE